MTGIAALPVLASAGSNAVLFAIGLGIVVVALLIGAFWWGSRRVARRRRPAGGPVPTDTRSTDTRAGSDSWKTPDDPDTRGSGR